MTPIKPGTASRLGLRKPQPDAAWRIAHFAERHLGVGLSPWQVSLLGDVYTYARRQPEPEYLAHYEIHADGRVVDNTERLRQR